MRTPHAVRIGFLGAALALLPAAANAAEPIKSLGRQLSLGECVQANGIDNRGKLCIRRDPASTDGKLRYYFTYSGLWTHMNIRVLQSQSELSKKAGNRTITITRSLQRNVVITVRVQACLRPEGFIGLASSKCTFWQELRIRA